MSSHFLPSAIGLAAAVGLAACHDAAPTAPETADLGEAALRPGSITLDCDPASMVVPAASSGTITCTASTTLERGRLPLRLSVDATASGLTARPLAPLPTTVTADEPVQFAFAIDAGPGTAIGQQTVTIQAAKGAKASAAMVTVEVASAGPVVRVAYLVPTDMTMEPAAIDSLDRTLRRAQSWYQANVGSGRTFAIGIPSVTVYDLAHPAAYYPENVAGADPSLYYWFNTTAEAVPLTGASYQSTTVTWLFVNAASAREQIGSAAVQGYAINDGLVLDGLMGRNPDLTVCEVTGDQVHEFGHTFGLPHSDPPSVMSYIWDQYPNVVLHAAEQAVVAANGFFQQAVGNPTLLSCDGSGLFEEAGAAVAAEARGDRGRGAVGGFRHPEVMPLQP